MNLTSTYSLPFGGDMVVAEHHDVVLVGRVELLALAVERSKFGMSGPKKSRVTLSHP
jgi:hypothetical protein